MKTIIISLFYLAFSNVFYSQSIQVEYEQAGNVYEQLKSKNLDSATYKRVSAHLSKPTLYKLIQKGKESLYSKQSEIKKTNGDAYEVGVSLVGVYKNFDTKKFSKDSDISGKEIIIDDSFVDFDWKVTDETKKIGSFNCIKALGKFNGEEIIAWYSPDIPVSNGPDIFEGLPGLIVSLTTPAKVYNAINYTVTEQKASIDKPENGKRVTLAEYNQIVDNLVSDIKKNNGKVYINN